MCLSVCLFISLQNLPTSRSSACFIISVGTALVDFGSVLHFILQVGPKLPKLYLTFDVVQSEEAVVCQLMLALASYPGLPRLFSLAV